MFGLFKKKEPPKAPSKRFPPVPDWQPSIAQPLDLIIDRIRHYTDGERDFAVFNNGTAVILPNGLSDEQAVSHATESLHKVFHAHPDMHPLAMKDGNILVRYNHDVLNVVLSEVTTANWQEIEQQHQRAIATDEVLITPLGHNRFDEFGMKALFGRCFMFMDAQAPKVVRIARSAA
ncbi:hypothetical protein LOY67_04720 [Pseudomonas sp. B21-056]|uniref:hypothetical protein n=1 Tax=Pseudomonas sp. B21-056 TaxID=2895495 RepID=UPI002232916C|nr:hypothetical protein [Pseudomonas sp. B21-056]UZE24723.1 hypothetical protein LOY67_04720 [Pseudomonas sp. B21-056]